ncbi:MAG TPA: allantoicase [Thermoanaerobaculia bacterium]|nr:allantoicase [Thermoanaerobaculia bacterium]
MSDFTELVDLAAERLGGAVLAANDEFFAPKENLLKSAAPVWMEGKYTDVGKWMDGWETRRRREPGHDWCLIRLGLPGAPRGVVVDTSFFRGNFPDQCSLEACAVEGYPTTSELFDEEVKWTVILPRVSLQGDFRNLFAIEKGIGDMGDMGRVTHLLFRIYPDGGVARLRVHGDVLPDWERLDRRRSEMDLAGVENGGRVLACSDMFFGNRHNLILPGPPRGMHDGWETRRRRGEGFDWAIVRLGARGLVERLEIDTSFFKGNAPGSGWVEGIDAPGAYADALSSPSFPGWREILPKTPLRPHTVHHFDDLLAAGPFTHVRLGIHPDGGVARLRVFGRLGALDLLNVLPVPDVEARLLACCGSRTWAGKVARARPFHEPQSLFTAAERAFGELGRNDWLEAFAAHPRIGERPAGDGVESRWSTQEQAGADEASAEILAELAEANRLYEQRFGHVFLVCATGKSAFEMLNLLGGRLGNDASTELEVAAGEQREITRLRLEKLLWP